MGSRSNGLAGMEVPIIGTDSVKWIEITVPSSSSSDSDTSGSSSIIAPPTQDYCCSVLIGADSYLICRIHKTSPHSLQLLDFPSSSVGLRLTFPHPLSPFAFICINNQINSTTTSRNTNLYLLYALTVSGVAYVFQLSNLSDYASSSSSLSVFPPDDFIEFNLHTYFSNSNDISITSVAAYAGCLLIGTNHGSVASFQLPSLPHTAPGFVHELRDDSGIARLWGFMSR